jgi:hypothetical protein
MVAHETQVILTFFLKKCINQLLWEVLFLQSAKLLDDLYLNVKPGLRTCIQRRRINRLLSHASPLLYLKLKFEFICFPKTVHYIKSDRMHGMNIHVIKILIFILTIFRDYGCLTTRNCYLDSGFSWFSSVQCPVMRFTFATIYFVLQ